MRSRDVPDVEKRPSENKWDASDGTTYVLGYIPSGPCAECGASIDPDAAGYIRDGPRANDGDGGLDELCFDCGNQVTDFA